MTSQERTLDHYQELMTINAASHVLRSGRELGVFEQLAGGQKTLEQLSDLCGVRADRLSLLLRSLRAIGILETYHDDYALSSTARLLCQYDGDLGDHTWNQLTHAMRTPAVDPGVSADLPRDRDDAIAATQWVHTPAAMQAAEILNLGPEGDWPGPKRLLDLGCGSAVWSCAMAHRDPEITITAIDSPAAIASAAATAASIQLADRFETIPGDVLQTPLGDETFDIVLLAQRLHSLVPAQIDVVLGRAAAATRPGGKVIVIDAFNGSHAPSLSESLEALRLAIQSPAADVPDIAVAKARMERAGLDSIQFTYIAASRIGLGMIVGGKP